MLKTGAVLNIFAFIFYVWQRKIEIEIALFICSPKQIRSGFCQVLILDSGQLYE